MAVTRRLPSLILVSPFEGWVANQKWYMGTCSVCCSVLYI